MKWCLQCLHQTPTIKHSPKIVASELDRIRQLLVLSHQRKSEHCCRQNWWREPPLLHLGYIQLEEVAFFRADVGMWLRKMTWTLSRPIDVAV